MWNFQSIFSDNYNEMEGGGNAHIFQKNNCVQTCQLLGKKKKKKKITTLRDGLRGIIVWETNQSLHL